MSNYSDVTILPALLRIAHELVWFEASEIDFCLVLNPEIGTFSSLRRHEFREFVSVFSFSPP